MQSLKELPKFNWSLARPKIIILSNNFDYTVLIVLGSFEMSVKIWRFIALMLTAFSLSLSMTHLLEFPRRMLFDKDLWVRVTVFEGVYAMFGLIGAFFEPGAILAVLGVAFLVRGRPKILYWTLVSAALLFIAFMSWILFVNSANAELARWLTNPVPTDWTRTRNQWEYAHAVNAFIKIFGMAALVVSVIIDTKGGKNYNGRTNKFNS